MQQDKEITSTDKIVHFIERWSLLFIVVIVYLFLSIKSLIFLLNPPKLECGLPFIGAIMAQVLIAIIATIIVILKFYFGVGYSLWTKIIVFALILIPVIITFAVYH